MTLPELTRRLEELERRLEVKENALNEALKEIEELRGKQIRPGRVLKDTIEPVVYEYLFDYCYDKKTGEKCKADDERMNKNFRNLFQNVMMACGYTYAAVNSRDGAYYAKVQPVNDIPESEYSMFCTLMQDITALMYTFKANRKCKEENNEKIRNVQENNH